MSVTASRIGSSPLTLDWSGLSQVAPRRSATSRQHIPSAIELSAAWSRLKTRLHSNDVGFYDLPVSEDLSQIRASTALARGFLDSGSFTDALFLGIGGSSLGPISLLHALEHRRSGGLRIHFAENPDPMDWKLTLSRLRPATTLVCIVTKSGTTFETLAQALAALDWLGRDLWKTHVVAITDPQKGDLRRFATDHGIRSLDIHPSIGGRFSLFSPVGLFPAALAGLSLDDLLLGARQVREACEKLAPEKNPLLFLGDHLIQHFSARPIHVCMPYSTRLRWVADWWVQLWGESLGKDGKGFTPVGALGTNDQHSLVQLLRDGPDDKVTQFISISEVDDAVTIPTLKGDSSYDAFRLLEGHTFQELLTTEYHATAQVLTRGGRPNWSVHLDRLDERSLGALYFGYCVMTAFTGVLWEINPFDQPGVEEGKIYIRDSLSGQRG